MTTATSDRARISICVLPFANASGDPEQEYFSNGIAEDIIADLRKVSALTVVGRNVSFAWKGQPAAEVARKLKVTHGLEGSVRKAGSRMEVDVHLMRAGEGASVWSQRYEHAVDDIFALQTRITVAIVEALKLQLPPAEKKAIETRSTSNPEAYKLYQMARQFQVSRNARHRELVVKLCRRAVALDPNYGRAWGLLAIALSSIPLMDGQPTEGGMAAADRALALDPTLAQARAARGRLLADAGRHDEARVEHEQALRLNPDSYDVNAAAARYFMAVRRHADAIPVLERAAALAPQDVWAPGMAIACYESIGDAAGVKRAAQMTLDRAERSIVAEPDDATALGFGVAALARLGQRDRAIEWADRAMLFDPDNGNLRYNTACAMAVMDEHERALDLLSELLRTTRKSGLEWFKVDTDLDPLRDNPEFQLVMSQAEARLAAEAKPAG